MGVRVSSWAGRDKGFKALEDRRDEVVIPTGKTG